LGTVVSIKSAFVTNRLDPVVHADVKATWIAGSSPAMTKSGHCERQRSNPAFPHSFLDCLVAFAPRNDEQVAPKNQARCVLFSERRTTRNALIHRHKCKAFDIAADIAAAMTITAPSRSRQGRRPVTAS
jgi:hypothetical protein